MDQRKQQARARPKASSPKAKAGQQRGQDARVAAPLTQTRIMRTESPTLSNSASLTDGRIRVKHREYIADVVGSPDFSVTSYSVNPGLSTTFSWLPSIARNYESYRFHKLCFEYETQKSANTDGTIILAMDFDASDAPPVNKQALMAYHNAVRSAVWAECKYTASSGDLAKFTNQRYVRIGSLSPNEDIKTFDVGNLFIGTQGSPSSTNIGELYVSYDVEFFTPQTSPFSDSNAISAKVRAGSGLSRFLIFGTGATITGGLPIAASGNTLTFGSAGKYIVQYDMQGVNWNNSSPALTVSANLTATPVVGGTNAWKFNGSDGQYTILVTTTQPNQTLVVDVSALCTSITDTTLRIATYNTTLG